MADPAQPPPYTLTVKEDEGVYRFLWDDTAVIDAVVLRPNTRGQYDVTASFEGIVRSQGTLDLLHLRDQEALHRLASHLDGSVNWLQRIVQITPDLRQAREAAQVPWPGLQPLPAGLLPVPVLPLELLPEALRPWLADIAERMQVPLEFPAVPALVALASIIGNRLLMRPKAHDDWTVTPNLWGGVVARPGAMKTPAIQEALRPLYRLVHEAKAQHAEALQSWVFDKESADAMLAATRDKLKQAAKKGQDLEQYRATLANGPPKAPTERRYIVNDATVEKLGELLNENPSGLLLFRDELTGWLRSLDDERRANDRAFYLEAWSGDGTYTYDRIGRGTITIHTVTTSVLGGIQPGPLQTYLRGALGYGEGDDGLLQRFQLAVYPDLPPEWRYIDRWPETEAKNRAYEVFARLSALDPSTLGAPREEEVRPLLHFAPDAQDLFVEWFSDLRRALRAGLFVHPALESHVAKYASLMPSLGLLFELTDQAAQDFAAYTGEVSLDNARRAAAWCDFLLCHAKRIYGLGLEADAMHARTIAQHLKRGDLPEPFTARGVYLKHWSGLDTAKAAAQPIELLEHYGWIRGTEVRTGGRPTILYTINPAIKETPL